MSAGWRQNAKIEQPRQGSLSLSKMIAKGKQPTATTHYSLLFFIKLLKSTTTGVHLFIRTAPVESYNVVTT